jgi:hypothetical protein
MPLVQGLAYFVVAPMLDGELTPKLRNALLHSNET